MKAFLIVFLTACFLVGSSYLVSMKNTTNIWRDEKSMSCLKWGQHKEDHPVYVKGIQYSHWITIHYCLEKPDASINE